MYETRFLRSIYINKDQNLVKLHEIIENTLIDAGKSKTLAFIIKQSQKQIKPVNQQAIELYESITGEVNKTSVEEQVFNFSADEVMKEQFVSEISQLLGNDEQVLKLCQQSNEQEESSKDREQE